MQIRVGPKVQPAILPCQDGLQRQQNAWEFSHASPADPCWTQLQPETGQSRDDCYERHNVVGLFRRVGSADLCWPRLQTESKHTGHAPAMLRHRRGSSPKRLVPQSLHLPQATAVARAQRVPGVQHGAAASNHSHRPHLDSKAFSADLPAKANRYLYRGR